jgi:hypothetical protein
MRKGAILIVSGCCLSVAIFAWAQGKGKAGLWEVTTTRTMSGMQMPQMPQGAQMPPGMAARMGGAPTTTQVCVTQAMVDKYSGPPPQSRGDCSVTNMTPKAAGFTADIACTGQFNGKGTVDMTIVDAEHTKTKMHMTGTGGPQGHQIDMTIESSGVYKGADCGDVKPMQMPSN